MSYNMSAPQKFEESSSRAGSKTVLTADGLTLFKSGRKSRFTRLELFCFLLLFVLLIALIAVIVALVLKDDKTTQDVCTSSACVTAAANMFSKMDESVDPCEDFDKFACGGWLKGQVIPEDRRSVDTFSELQTRVTQTIKGLLEASISDSDSPYVKQVKTLYASCLNYDLINKKGPGPFMEVIKKDFGGWPLTTPQWDPESFNLTDTITRLNLNNVPAMIPLMVSTNRKNSSKRILVIDQPGFVMPGQKYYLVPKNDSMLEAYRQLIFEVGKVFGFANDSTARAEVEDIVEFETQLANISEPSEKRRDSNRLYNPMTLGEIKEKYKDIIDWRRMIDTIMSTPGIDIDDVTDDEIIINRSPLYFERLIDVLKETKKRTLANYLIWVEIDAMKYTQGDVIRDHYKAFKKALFGVNNQPPRYRQCVGYTTNVMELAVGKLFIKDNFDAESKNMALNMIHNLQTAFNQILDKADWMDDETRKVAKEKNAFINEKIGYPEVLTNETEMVQMYENFTFTKDNFMQNAFIHARERYKISTKHLREPIDKTKSFYNPSEVNAYYSTVLNQIMFPAGILQPPFFSKTFPQSFNYGGIGVVIGHEITHGFDDSGRQYDKEGNLVQWWSDSAIKKFKSKAQCIIDQYSNYTVESVNMHLNGINTQGENIADNGGLKESFQAYRSWVAKRGKEEQPLPGLLNYSHNQLFFINFAQIWCSKMRDGDVISRIRTGVHSLGRFRTIGTAQNSEDFSRVFGCSATAKMNPKKKCSVW